MLSTSSQTLFEVIKNYGGSFEKDWWGSVFEVLFNIFNSIKFHEKQDIMVGQTCYERTIEFDCFFPIFLHPIRVCVIFLVSVKLMVVVIFVFRTVIKTKIPPFCFAQLPYLCQKCILHKLTRMQSWISADSFRFYYYFNKLQIPS